MIRRGVFVDGARPRKLKNFEAAEYPPPIAQRPRTEARFISNVLLLKTEFVLCDGQLSFSHWILQVEPSPCLVATFPSFGLFPGKIDKIQTRPVSQAAFRSIR